MSNIAPINQNVNPDAITGEPGSHPIGTGLGAAGAASAGAIIGAAAGPVGAIAGAIIGAVAGGLAGKEVAEMANPTLVDDYWRINYSSRPYIAANASYEHYKPAYNFGYEQRNINRDRKFKEIEEIIRTNWEKLEGASKLEWEEAREAVRDSYELGDGFYNLRHC